MKYQLYYLGFKMGRKDCNKGCPKKRQILRSMQRDGIELNAYNKGYLSGYNVEMNRNK